MKQFITCCILYLFLLITLSGCWDQHEIEKRATIIGLAVDIATPEEVEKEQVTASNTNTTNDKVFVKLTGQLAVPGKIQLGPKSGESSPDEAVWTVEGYGQNIGDAIQSMQQKLAHDVFLGHLQVIIISPDVFKKGMNDINDYFKRRTDIRRSIWMALATDKAADLLNISPKLELVPAMYLATSLDQATEMGKFPDLPIDQYWFANVAKGKHEILPYLEQNGDNIRIAGLAYQNDDIHYVDPFHVIFYNGITGEKPGGASAIIKLTNGNVLMESNYRRVKYEVKLKNGMPTINVTIGIEGVIEEKSNKAINLHLAKTIQSIEKSAKKMAEEESLNLIEDTQKNQSDIFGFGEVVRAHLPKYWNEHVKKEADWERIYEKIPIHVTYEVKVAGIGTQLH